MSGTESEGDPRPPPDGGRSRWDGSETERGIDIRQVMVPTVLERTDWLQELRELASQGRSRCASRASTRPSRPPRRIERWKPEASAVAR